MSKRFVLSGYFGFKNFGDEAILSVLVKKLKQDKHRLTIISSDPKYTMKQYKHIRSVYTFKILDIIGAISKSDVLISGGGSLLQDVTSIKSLVYYLFIIFLGLVLHKKVIIFAQGIGPINNQICQLMTKTLLKHCTYVSVRDNKSSELLKSWGINADLLCDPIFSTEIPETEKKDVVAVQLRDFRTMNEDFIDRLAQKIVSEFPNKPVEIYSFQDAIDLNICQKLEKSIQLLNSNVKVSLYSDLTNEEIVERLSQAKYLIAMRFHAIIVGLLSGVNILSINYDIKVEKISKEFNLPMIDLKKDFKNQFELLKNEVPQDYMAKVKSKNFDWSGFEKAIES